MKKANPVLLLTMLLMAIVVSCKKNTGYTASGSLNYVNAVVNAELLTADFGIDKRLIFYDVTQAFRYASPTSYNFQSLPPGPNKLDIYGYGDTTEHDSPLASVVLDIVPADMYTLFLSGNRAQIDTVLIKEQFPAYAVNDSSFSVRFLNLSRGTNPVSAEIDEVPQTGATSIVYKAKSNWIPLSAQSKVSNYQIRFKDQVTGNILATATLENINLPGDATLPNPWRRNNYSIALIGDPAATTGEYVLKVLLVRHFFPG
ncbi:DUF4397 domain-containing protein [Pseudoflavitalea rhizosphaerae]|uniref:DUF4397 domain-containing protein n=1 Tax=Pseudoflavitalea rhizosphaerae TaxID=1884793 RepID=UPI000F8CE271|nr:DUF4397 domain-containing protein [Pseudoflavitalea rhizosphaerae]